MFGKRPCGCSFKAKAGFVLGQGPLEIRHSQILGSTVKGMSPVPAESWRAHSLSRWNARNSECGGGRMLPPKVLLESFQNHGLSTNDGWIACILSSTWLNQALPRLEADG